MGWVCMCVRVHVLACLGSEGWEHACVEGGVRMCGMHMLRGACMGWVL